MKIAQLATSQRFSVDRARLYPLWRSLQFISKCPLRKDNHVVLLSTCSGIRTCQSFMRFHSTSLAPSQEPKRDVLVDRSQVSGLHGAYSTEYAMSLSDPEQFWAKAADTLEWHKKPTNILEKDASEPTGYSWFSDGIINTCYNCLDVQVNNGRGDQVALHYDSPLTNSKRKYTYRELLEQVSKCAGALKDMGVETGDRVVIYMPMVPEAVIAMLACTRIGAVHAVVFGGFAAPELATRISDTQPKVIISASAGIEPARTIPYKPLLDSALELATHDVKHCLILQRHDVQTCDMGRLDVDFEQAVSNASPVDAVPVPATHLHHILHTSGTTGLPKGIVRNTGGWATALKYSMSAFYDTNPGETFWAGSDIGWIVGQAYIVYAPLMNGCSTVLYEGKPVGTPDAGAFWRVIEEYSVKTFFTAPTAFRAIKQADPNGELSAKYDLSSLKTLFLAGEHCDPDTLHWCENAMKKYGVPAIDHWWQTEIGWPGLGNAVGLGRIPVKHGACAAPVPGYDVRVVDDNGNDLPKNELGNLVVKLPLPPGTLSTILNSNERCIAQYFASFPGYYDTGDSAYIDSESYVHVMGRRDDVINTAGHRLSTGSMEEILLDHPEIADCAVIGVKDSLKGQVPVAFAVTIAGSTSGEEQIKSQLVQMVRERLGPVASFKKVAIVKALPKTRSGKILRGTMSKIANDKPWTITPTIEDPTIFDYLEPEIKKMIA